MLLGHAYQCVLYLMAVFSNTLVLLSFRCVEHSYGNEQCLHMEEKGTWHPGVDHIYWKFHVGRHPIGMKR